jgi:hypothetical protein
MFRSKFEKTPVLQQGVISQKFINPLHIVVIFLTVKADNIHFHFQAFIMNQNRSP